MKAPVQIRLSTKSESRTKAKGNVNDAHKEMCLESRACFCEAKLSRFLHIRLCVCYCCFPFPAGLPVSVFPSLFRSLCPLTVFLIFLFRRYFRFLLFFSVDRALLQSSGTLENTTLPSVVFRNIAAVFQKIAVPLFGAGHTTTQATPLAQQSQKAKHFVYSSRIAPVLQSHGPQMLA